MRVVVVGDSHVHAIESALRSKPVGGWCAFRFRRAKPDGSTIGSLSLDELPNLFSELSPNDRVVTAVEGSFHAILGLTLDASPFDFVMDGAADFPLVPHRALASLFDARLDERSRPTLEAVRAAAPCPVIQLICPPPKEGEHGRVRLKLWQMEARRTVELCQSIGIGALPPPPRAVAPEGFLAPDCHGKDRVHANARYGKMVVSAMLRACER